LAMLGFARAPRERHAARHWLPPSLPFLDPATAAALPSRTRRSCP
jgi:hypothetical protein